MHLKTLNRAARGATKYASLVGKLLHNCIVERLWLCLTNDAERNAMWTRFEKKKKQTKQNRILYRGRKTHGTRAAAGF
jgi:hypothetical protein